MRSAIILLCLTVIVMTATAQIISTDGEVIAKKENYYSTMTNMPCWILVYNSGGALLIQSNSTMMVTASKYPMIRFKSLADLTNKASALGVKIPKTVYDQATNSVEVSTAVIK